MDGITLVIGFLIIFIAAYIILDRICKCIQYVAVCKAFAKCSEASGKAINAEKEIKGFMGDIMELSKGKNADGK